MDSASKYLPTLSSTSPGEEHDSPVEGTKRHDKPMVVGLYGISGSGKTTIMGQLRNSLGTDHFSFYEGSAMINRVVPGGLSAFRNMPEHEKEHWRQIAIQAIGQNHSHGNSIAVVTGHYMFWPEIEGSPQAVCTRADLETYTHILYLNTPAEVINQQRLQDDRDRPLMSVTHLEQWQKREADDLRQLCYDHHILFSLVTAGATALERISRLLRDFQDHSEEANTLKAQAELDQLFLNNTDLPERMIVLDADRTLTADDTGRTFWKKALDDKANVGLLSPLKQLFGSRPGYTHGAFCQAALLYEDLFDSERFETTCLAVATETKLHPQFTTLLRVLATQSSLGVIIVTCGLRRIWEKIMQNEGLDTRVKVFGSGRFTSDYIVTPDVKAALVSRLRLQYQARVVSFGDSILDLKMLECADQAIVVVGDERTRSKTMDEALRTTLQKDAFTAKQVLLPSNVSPRCDESMLPIMKLTNSDDVMSLLGDSYQTPELELLQPTDTSAIRLLQTPTRNAKISGPRLREAHVNNGWYLAINHLGSILNLEEYPMRHVQGHVDIGYRLLHEKQTLIVALMRGGEPMALGISNAFPKAMFLHAGKPCEILAHHVEKQVNVILVDSVINSGKSIIDFVQHINNLHATIRIVIVASVVQAESIDRLRALQSSIKYNRLSLVFLRSSTNKFTGQGGTDTGNRLFNTTSLP